MTIPAEIGIPTGHTTYTPAELQNAATIIECGKAAGLSAGGGCGGGG